MHGEPDEFTGDVVGCGLDPFEGFGFDLGGGSAVGDADGSAVDGVGSALVAGL